MNYVSNVEPIVVDYIGFKWLCNPMSYALIERIEALGGIVTSEVDDRDKDRMKLHYWVKFPDNRYYASIIKGYGTYGVEKDEWELGVIDSLFNELTYNTDLSSDFDDVIGYLDDEELLSKLKILSHLDEYGRVKPS